MVGPESVWFRVPILVLDQWPCIASGYETHRRAGLCGAIVGFWLLPGGGRERGEGGGGTAGQGRGKARANDHRGDYHTEMRGLR